MGWDKGMMGSWDDGMMGCFSVFVFKSFQWSETKDRHVGRLSWSDLELVSSPGRPICYRLVIDEFWVFSVLGLLILDWRYAHGRRHQADQCGKGDCPTLRERVEVERDSRHQRIRMVRVGSAGTSSTNGIIVAGFCYWPRHHCN